MVIADGLVLTVLVPACGNWRGEVELQYSQILVMDG